MNETNPPRNRITPILIAVVIIYIIVAIAISTPSLPPTQLPPPTNYTLPPLFTARYYDECISQQLSDNCTIWRVPTLLELRWYLGWL